MRGPHRSAPPHHWCARHVEVANLLGMEPKSNKAANQISKSNQPAPLRRGGKAASSHRLAKLLTVAVALMMLTGPGLPSSNAQQEPGSEPTSQSEGEPAASAGDPAPDPIPAPTQSASQDPSAPVAPTDLVVEIMPPVDVDDETDLNVQGRITNHGQTSEPTTGQLLLRTPGTERVLDEFQVPSLAPGASHAYEFPWTVPPGTHRISLTINEPPTSAESDPTNNFASTFVHRAYAAPVDVDHPIRFETQGTDADAGASPDAKWEDGKLRLTIKPKGNSDTVALVHQEWLDSRIDVAALDNGTFALTLRDGVAFYAFSVPGGKPSSYTFEPFQPAEEPRFGRGSLQNVMLGDRPMRVAIIDKPHTEIVQRELETPNGTIQEEIPITHTRLSIAFEDAVHDGQDVWIKASWLEEVGITVPAARHEDETPIPMKRVGNHWLLQPEHFSVVHIFNSNQEMWTKVSAQPNSEVSWESVSGNGRMKIVQNRVDTLDESMVRNFVPGAQWAMSMNFGVVSQGNWQALYPFIIANRAERTNPSGADNYAAPGSFGFFYYSRDDYSQLPEIQAYYYPVGGSKQMVWPTPWNPTTHENWQVTLSISVGATSTTFSLLDINAQGPSGSVLNSQLPMSTVDVISFGSEDLDTDGLESTTLAWVDAFVYTQTVGSTINQDFSSTSGWTTYGSTTCCTGGYVQLTDNVANQIGRIHYNTGMNAARFSATFRFYSGPNTGGADGLAMFFFKNLAYTAYPPAGGGELGLADTDHVNIAGHEGYGFIADEYQNSWTNPTFTDPSNDYVAFVTNDATQQVAVAGPANIKNGQWHTVDIEVWDNYVSVWYDNILFYYNSQTFTRTYSGFGFTAATGGLSNYHRIDYVRVSSAGTPNTPPPTPLQSSPTNGQTVATTTPTIDWTDVSDPNGVNYLLYFGAGAPSSTPYANPSSSFWTITSALQYNTQYCWRVVAQDGLGAQSASTGPWCFWTPAPPPTTTAPPGNGLNENFNSGANLPTGWTRASSSTDPQWHTTTRRSYSPSYAAWYGRPTTGTYDNGAGNSGSITSPSFVVPSTNAALTFRDWFQSELSTYYDRRDVMISTNGGTSWTCIASSYSSCYGISGSPTPLASTQSTWALETVGLTAFAGQTANLRWSFNTIDSAGNAYEGWYLDDIVVNGVANQAPSKPVFTLGPTTGFVGTQYTYKARSSDDGSQVRYLFDWYDGQTTWTPLVAQNTDGTAAHTWTSAGTFYVKVKAEDTASPALQSVWSDNYVVTISQFNNPPTACINNPTWPTGDGLTMRITSCSTDPDPGDTAALAHTWNWGDGSPTSSGATPPDHAYACPGGAFTVTLTVSDGKASPVSTNKVVTANPADNDENVGDGLKDCLETPSGYGTDPTKRDTDQDGLNDGTELAYWNGISSTAWQTNYQVLTPDAANPQNNLLRKDADGDGLKDGLEFVPPISLFCGSVCESPSPTVRDVYVEVDWMNLAGGQPYKLTAAQLTTMKNLFSAHNIRLHIDQGDLGGGSEVTWDQQFTSPDGQLYDDWDRLYNNDFVGSLRQGFKDGHFLTPPRRGVYHYAVMAHNGEDNCPVNTGATYGLSSGDMLVVFRGCIVFKNPFDSATYIYNTFLHELGHSLFGDIEPDVPDADKTCCDSNGNYLHGYPGHDIYQDKIMWWFKNTATDYHTNRWNCISPVDNQCDIDDLGEGLLAVPTSNRQDKRMGDDFVPGLPFHVHVH